MLDCQITHIFKYWENNGDASLENCYVFCPPRMHIIVIRLLRFKYSVFNR
jgi:hypothetical protein